jgi:hypothetical protein
MRFTIFLLTLLLLQSCSSYTLNDYADNQPVINIEHFFAGKLVAHGVVKNRQGDVTRFFSATIDAYWKDGVGVLDEEFHFDDGEVQLRQWQLTPQGQGHYLATANDVVGTHTMRTKGNAIFLDYVLRLPYKGDSIDVTVDDKMFLLTDNRIINESVFYKWGFRVGSVQLVIEKL